jgi:cold shock CspA family protein
LTVVSRQRRGIVDGYDEAAGHGTIVDDAGRRWWFHCTAIADGTRTIDTGAAVRFRLAPGTLGRYEATGVEPA